MDEINGEQIINVVKTEKKENEDKNIIETINMDNASKDKMPAKNNRYKNDEIESIINKDPLLELKLIQEKINNENKKIKQINSQLEKININNSKSTKKGNKEFKDDYEAYNNKNKKSKFNNLLSANINISSSQQLFKNNSLSLDPTLNIIQQKIENLRKIKVEKIKPNNKNIEEENYLTEKRNNSNIKGNINNKNKLDLRLLAIEEEIKKDKEEKQKQYENKVKSFIKKELEREKQRKNLVNQINNISLSQQNKYLPKRNYITSEEREEMRKIQEESLLQIEKEKRKMKYLPISSEELNNFSNEVKKNEKILKSELKKKKKQMEELWKERKNLLPKYHSKFMDLNIDLDNEAKEEIFLKKEKLKNKEIERVNFGKEILENYKPKILNDKLKTEREQRIQKLKGINRYEDIKELGSKLKQKAVKLVQSQPKTNKKNIFVARETVAQKQAKKLTGKPVDFLLERRNEKAKMDYETLLQDNSAKKMKEWKEMLDSGDKNTYNKVEKIKMQAAVMNEQANDINKLIKHESNNMKKDELSQEASSLYINSIQAKLQILNKLMDN